MSLMNRSFSASSTGPTSTSSGAPSTTSRPMRSSSGGMRPGRGWPMRLDARRIPYIGSDSRTMKAMIDKYQTHEILAAGGVAVPAHVLFKTGDDVALGHLPGLRQTHLRIPVGRHLRRERRPKRRGTQAARGPHRARIRRARPGRGIPAWRRIYGARLWATGKPGNACPGWSPSKRSTSGITGSSGATCEASA